MNYKYYDGLFDRNFSYAMKIREGMLDTRLLLKYAKAFSNGDNIIETIMEVIS